MKHIQKITPFLWFNDQAEAAVEFYIDIFEDSRVISLKRFPDGPQKGKVLTAVFELEGQRFMAIDGGPMYTLSGAVSMYVDCSSQGEVDRLWDRLTEDGGEELMCGWCTDKFGVTWQIIPSVLPELLTDPNPDKAARAMEALMQMKKIDVTALQSAHEGA